MTSFLSVVSGTELVCVECAQGHAIDSLILRPGRVLPLHAGAAGRVALAYFEDADAERYLAGAPFPAYNENTLVSVEQLREDIRLTRERGYALSDEDVTLGVGAVGVTDCGQRVRSRDRQPVRRWIRGRSVSHSRILGRVTARWRTRDSGSLIRPARLSGWTVMPVSYGLCRLRFCWLCFCRLRCGPLRFGHTTQRDGGDQHVRLARVGGIPAGGFGGTLQTVADRIGMYVELLGRGLERTAELQECGDGEQRRIIRAAAVRLP